MDSAFERRWRRREVIERTIGASEHADRSYARSANPPARIAAVGRSVAVERTLATRAIIARAPLSLTMFVPVGRSEAVVEALRGREGERPHAGDLREGGPGLCERVGDAPVGLGDLSLQSQDLAQAPPHELCLHGAIPAQEGAGLCHVTPRSQVRHRS